MKFINAHIENFGPLGKIDLDLNERGLVLIQGLNNHNTAANSNGAGKSSIFDALSWCLYGKTAKGQTGDAVINRTVGKGCLVHIELLDNDGDTYTVTRGRKHKTFKSKLHLHVETKAGAVTDLTKGTDKLTQEAVEQVLGCPYDVFIGAVYAGQEKMPDMPAMADSKLKVLIEEAAGITVLDKAYTIARQRLNDAKAEFETNSRKLERAEHDEANAVTRLKDAKDTSDRWIAERDARIMDGEATTRILLRDAKSFKEQMAKLKSEDEILSQRRLNKSKMDRRDEEIGKLEELESLSQAASFRANKIKGAAEAITVEVKRLRAELEQLQSQIGEPCSSCKRLHDSKSLGAAIEAKKAEIGKSMQNAKDTIELYKVASAEAQSASQSASIFKDKMTDMKEALELSEQLSDQLNKVQKVKSQYEDALRRAIEGKKAIEAEQAKTNPNASLISDRQTELKATKETVKKIKDDAVPLKQKVRVAQSVVSVYSPKGVRAHILDTVTPYLNDRTAHYLGALTDGELSAVWQTITLTAKGEARENFSINVSGDDGHGSFNDLSGGEKRKVRIACSLALQDLVSTRASKSLDLFIADEIDDALDESGLERLMGLLDEKALERGSVFIISHNSLSDWCSQVLTVEKEAGMSKVVA